MKSETKIKAEIKTHRDELESFARNHVSGFDRGYALGYAQALEWVLEKEEK